MSRRLMLANIPLLALMFAAPALAVDGQVLVNHSKALAGNVTPGDLPGYPVTLSVQGSYKLSGNLTAPAGINGIDAAADDITIDLNGFRIEGSGAGNVGVLGTQRNLRVRNGTIQRFRRGIEGGGSIILEDLRISENSAIGIFVKNGYARISRSTIILNTNLNRDGIGISCVQNAVCHIESNLIALNGSGVTVAGGLVRGNTITNNTAGGVVSSSIGTVGLGGNLIAGNGRQLVGSFVTGMKNACAPAACP